MKSVPFIVSVRPLFQFRFRQALTVFARNKTPRFLVRMDHGRTDLCLVHRFKHVLIHHLIDHRAWTVGSRVEENRVVRPWLSPELLDEAPPLASDAFPPPSSE